jgi:hypothetical protein
MLLEKVDLEKFGELSLKETKKFMPWNKCQKHCTNDIN